MPRSKPRTTKARKTVQLRRLHVQYGLELGIDVPQSPARRSRSRRLWSTEVPMRGVRKALGQDDAPRPPKKAHWRATVPLPQLRGHLRPEIHPEQPPERVQHR